ncbi:MAG TPA: adenylate kinase [Terriglobales bacterium]|nr:adenylate kinase [Terriglobales bacterium]
MLGPPGVGKGTQARRLAADTGGALISTGEILRDAVARATPLGLEARHAMEAGRLVEDEVMIGLVRERTAEADARAGFVLDGFPRTLPQGEALDALLAECGQKLDAVLYLGVAEEELVRRLRGRVECPVCLRAYHVDGLPSRDGVHCDDHPEAVLRPRADDSPEAVRRRFEEYRTKTAPLVDYYTAQELLRPVLGAGSVEDVHRALLRVLGMAPRLERT